MKRPRSPKKTDTLEVRLSHAAKQAFMARARERGRTASAVLREFVDSYVAEAPATETKPMITRYLKPAAATSIAASALALYALSPTAVAAAPDLRAVFEKLDRNQDGALSAEEFLARHGGDTVFVRHDSEPAPEAGPAPAARPFMIPLKEGAHPPHLTSGASPDASTALRGAFAAQDGDSNGAVSFGEFEAHHLAMFREGFRTLDVNDDGAIDRSEYGAALRHLPGAPTAGAVPFEQADRDGDAGISWDEFLARSV